MPLFDDCIRTRQMPLQRGEKLFDFYNTCASEGYDDFRGLLNCWIAAFPNDAQIELVSRMQNGGSRDFQAAAMEILAHALLTNLGFEILVHPNIEGTERRPDFKAIDPEGNNDVFVEVTTINPPAEEDARYNRETPVFNAINSVRLPPGCLLGYDLVRAGPNSPPLRRITREIETWARENVAVALQEQVTRIFNIQDWQVELQLFATIGDEVSQHAIGAYGGGAGWIAPHRDLRAALENKSRRYGIFDTPYLIVVADAKEQVRGSRRISDALSEAVFGDLAVEGGFDIDPRHALNNNGFWRGADGQRNQNVSGVLYLPSTELWTLRSENHQPVLGINPWSQHSLPTLFTQMQHFSVEGNSWSSRAGAIVADIVDLPVPWPPEF